MHRQIIVSLHVRRKGVGLTGRSCRKYERLKLNDEVVFKTMDYLFDNEVPYNLVERTKKFAIKIILLAEKLPNTTLGRHIKGQLIRCGSSVASNYRAARLAQSKASFISKLSIVIEESDESEFWLEMIEDLNLLNELYEVQELKTEAHELASIFITSRKTAQNRK